MRASSLQDLHVYVCMYSLLGNLQNFFEKKKKGQSEKKLLY